MNRFEQDAVSFVDLKRPDGETRQFFHFFLNAILKSRVDLGKESNEGYSPHLDGVWENDRLLDEDVNVYLAGLLTGLASPEHQRTMVRYVSERETEIHEKAKQGDPGFKFMLYKTNADYLLMLSGVFHHGSEEPGRREGLHERGRRYYGMAADYGERIYRRRTELLDALNKLRLRFDDYRDILSHMTNTYLEFVQPLTGAQEERLKSRIREARDPA